MNLFKLKLQMIIDTIEYFDDYLNDYDSFSIAEQEQIEKTFEIIIDLVKHITSNYKV